LFDKKHKKKFFHNFQSAVHQYSGLLFTICRRYARDETTAKDYLQDSWLRIYNNMEKYDESRPFEAWIRRITVNECLKNIRDQKNKFEELEDVKIDTTETPIEKLNNEELMELINTLPLVFKTVFNLYVIDGYTHKEIAELLQISEATSRSKLLRGRKWLQQKINFEKNKEHEFFTSYK